jgi:hypothetical protein
VLQDALLAVGRQAIEMLEPLFQLLLPLRRKPPERGIILKRAPLLIEWQLAVLLEPLSGVVPLWGRLRPGYVVSLLRSGLIPRLGSLLIVRLRSRLIPLRRSLLIMRLGGGPGRL